jgi:uncharacterized membrane protein YedE/YeeE
MDRIWALIVGVAMGALIQQVRASSPGMIARNLRLENLSIIKFMAVTIAVGSLLVYVMSLAMPMHFDIKPTYVVGVLVGGLVFGVGFGLGGYCPGTCVVGAAEGRKDAFWAILGGVVGALAFTLAYTTVVAPMNKLADYGKITLADVTHLPAVALAVALFAVFVAVVAWLPTVRGGEAR